MVNNGSGKNFGKMKKAVFSAAAHPFLKRNVTVLTLCLAFFVAMTACAPHSHQAEGGWLADGKEHWKVCAEDGEKMDAGAHTLIDAFICTVCGSEVIDFGESVSVSAYDDYGYITRMAEYSADGELLSETVNEYEYDADGHMLKEKQTIDGIPSGETEYTVIDGESVVSKFTAYYEDGSKSVSDYDIHGNDIRMVSYDAEGNVTFQSESEYAESSEGEWYRNGYTEAYSDGTKIACTYNADGDILSRVSYDADGNEVETETWEYTYGDNGHKATEKAYVDGKLTQELTYKTAQSTDESYTYPETVVEYDEAGGKTVFVYDENDNLVSETKYDAAGNEITD